MDDLGSPGSYLTLATGTRLYSSDGRELGRVTHVLAEPGVDIFDGLVVHGPGPLGGHRFVDAADVEGVFERGVVLKLDAEAAARRLHDPSGEAIDPEGGPRETLTEELLLKLHRARELISGRG